MYLYKMTIEKIYDIVIEVFNDGEYNSNLNYKPANKIYIKREKNNITSVIFYVDSTLFIKHLTSGIEQEIPLLYTKEFLTIYKKRFEVYESKVLSMIIAKSNCKIEQNDLVNYVRDTKIDKICS